MFNYIRALRSARLMGLVDRGMVENHQIYGLTPDTVHNGCYTRLRVGIDQAHNSFVYCWRCRQITLSSAGRIDTPEQRKYKQAAAARAKLPPAAETAGEKVVDLADYRKPAPPTAS